MACRPLSFGGLPTTRPSDFPEAYLWPASIRCREHANLRPKPNGLLIRDYVRDGDFTTPIRRRSGKMTTAFTCRCKGIIGPCPKIGMVAPKWAVPPGYLLFLPNKFSLFKEAVMKVRLIFSLWLLSAVFASGSLRQEIPAAVPPITLRW